MGVSASQKRDEGEHDIIKRHDFEGTDDDEALSNARHWLDGHDMEVWQPQRLVPSPFLMQPSPRPRQRDRPMSKADESKPGLTSDLAAKMKALERENRELRQANEILRKASAYFAQAELDRPFKR